VVDIHASKAAAAKAKELREIAPEKARRSLLFNFAQSWRARHQYDGHSDHWEISVQLKAAPAR
jgi:hypothetical protein